MSTSHSTFDFIRYLIDILSIPPEDFEVEILLGSYTNLTARATFKSPFSLPSSFGHTDPIQSVILKFAKPFMHALPSYAVPMSRQTVKAKALQILGGEELEGVVQAVLARSRPLKVPKLVFHDTDNHVIWMTDLGRSRILSDYILYGSPQATATKNPSSSITGSLADSRHLMEFLTSQTEQVATELPGGVTPEIAALLERMRSALDREVHPEQCLGMVDLWPGSVLIDDKGVCGLVDWEHFGLTDPGTDLGMFGKVELLHQTDI
ncbi:hypothetical protein FRC00_009785 [Tulasnella sp. 408]|nr:hypothetical protein FRC00_009785 [Tulasnella sp. 408]